ncbi:MAG: hypothetical protein P8Y03_30560 [Anaerolineales bacterium]|jgi:hypothetical protein
MLGKRMTILAVVMFSLVVALPVLADATGVGTVYEGVSVPGIALGDSRAQVEAVNGPPRGCHDINELNDLASCSFDVEGGGWVGVSYQGPNGGNAIGSPDDVVTGIRWGHVDGWATTAGVNTTLALNDKQAVVDAYPNADLYYDSVGRLYVLRDPELGIQVAWNHAYIFYDVYMSIFNPYTPPPPPDYIRVADIELFSNSRHSVTARVLVLDEQDQPVEGAVVDATWIYPKVDGLQVSGTTASNGLVTFTIDKARWGTYYFSISDVSLDGYAYDDVHSTNFAVFLNK